MSRTRNPPRFSRIQPTIPSYPLAISPVASSRTAISLRAPAASRRSAVSPSYEESARRDASSALAHRTIARLFETHIVQASS